MQGSHLWQRILKTRAMREQHAICPVCSLPLVFRLGVLARQDPMAGFVPENILLVHPECQEVVQRQDQFQQPPDFRCVAAE